MNQKQYQTEREKSIELKDEKRLRELPGWAGRGLEEERKKKRNWGLEIPENVYSLGFDIFIRFLIVWFCFLHIDRNEEMEERERKYI